MTTTTAASAPPTISAPARRRFTVAEYYAMAYAGILSENDRVELLAGDLIVMPPIGDWHAARVNLFTNLLPPRLEGRAIVSIQNPTRLDNASEPQPDVLLLQWRDDFYGSGHPGPADVLLLIEVSDTALDFDRNVKLPLYALAGIPEVWIVNRPSRCIEAYTEPSGNEYATVRYFGPGETVAPQAFPDITLAVDRIIGE
ncbi:MAG: Uma2 family endonuclease [Chloroflexota bacterium]|nr:Uma2 family endonuclease [Chloroflexota bacterium]MDE2961301.1 Uma2 family endonuclease [Chloroflexota bacterium]